MDASTAGSGIGLVIGLLIVFVFGAIVGWLASLIVKGSGLGLAGDIVLGTAGSFLAGFVLPNIGIGNPSSVVGAIFFSVAGAVALLLIVKLIRRA